MFKASKSNAVSATNARDIGFIGLYWNTCKTDILLASSKAVFEQSTSLNAKVRSIWPEDAEQRSNRVNRDTGRGKTSANLWILRGPTGGIEKGPGVEVARYPPRNMMNAEMKLAPRDTMRTIFVRLCNTPLFLLDPSTTGYPVVVALQREVVALGDERASNTLLTFTSASTKLVITHIHHAQLNCAIS